MTKQISPKQLLNCGLEANIATAILPQVNQWLASLPAVECWQHLVQYILKPSHPFALHELLYKTTFCDWDISQGQPPAWFPSQKQIQATNIAALMKELKLDSYAELHAWSAQHRAEFWEMMIKRLGICLQKPYTQIIDLSQGVELPQWLVGARLNIAESCFQAPADNPAIIFQPEGGFLTTWTYGELQALTNRVANGLVEAGFAPGDAIAIAMPMTAESVAIYLGIVKAGCVVVSIADSFAADEIATRLRISKAKAIFTQDYIRRGGKQLPLYAKIIAANAPRAILAETDTGEEDRGTRERGDAGNVLDRFSTYLKLRLGDLTWDKFLSSNDKFDAFPAHPTAYTNVLFSSGTTAEPKAIPWTQTTPIKCASDGHLHHDIHPQDVVAWPTNLGWMMGPWLIYASLVNKATIALYDGAPTERGFGEFIQDACVTMLGLVPSLVSNWKTTACMQGFDWSAIKAFSSTGECSNPQDMLFLMSLAGYKPIVEYCGGTEIGGAYITGTVVQPAIPSTFTTPALGLDFVILDEEGHLADKGEAFIVPPSIGLSTKLLNKDHHQVYFASAPSLGQALRSHGDQIERSPNGYYHALGRVDDTMNLSGIKVSSTEIEQILNTVEGICETAAIAISPSEGGPSLLIIYAVVESNVKADKEALKASLQTAIKQRLNPLFKIHDVVIVESLPRTASNKVMRRVLRDRYKVAVTKK
ncbi:AMP-binding protein [Chlorogloeopsis sp. ULAP01]|uniref:AMP-binding protein n=1 Tax=Chlorogloeopsis sp. ULAP01 TaxID=3056483 RepID=UPI0025AA7647|nr:AMP-binding protein [Chlorogloeopsis sp. ULAP01]MDM9379745.1 AMP-binding protein [Chlorogloeopsis sp. ULAP01]